MVPVVGLLCGDGYRRLPLAPRAARPRLLQSRFAAKRRAAAFCGRSVESLPSNAKTKPPVGGWFCFGAGGGTRTHTDDKSNGF